MSFYVSEKMENDISIIRIKLFVKWLYEVSEEISNNTLLSNDDLMTLLLSMKNTISDVNTEIDIMLHKITKDKKS